MYFLPSPPASPVEQYEDFDDFMMDDDNNEANIVCGSCNKALGSDWFCSNCHKKCSTCSRLLTQSSDDYCTRCWVYIPSRNIYVPSQRQLAAMMKSMPSPTNSFTSSNKRHHHHHHQ
ncbi:hypothetical protein O0I10_010309 [Lichtheimia ornata]|uniref:Uncharacterized protein n=1 Tax=Lichtheimia ornata TaxID=688661 RepID=A0AAD7XV28_9FUNG|nr:uncharacterized protein O0I10_010309 [Lichtheimia ornata]KAJ8654098.1 hypothetical protein O0I10_010309 [Lichtheimia ornata]